MRKLLKIVLILVAIGVLLLLAGTVALRIYLPPEKAKALVLHHLSTQLKRDVTLGSASVGLLSGLQMTDLKISESPNFSKGTFLSSEQFSLKIALLPLLFRKVIVRQIVLKSPEVSIIRQADGKSFNFSDLTNAPAPAATSPSSSEAKESLPFLLLVSRAQIQKGALHFIDRSPARQSMDIAPFDLLLKNVSLTSPFSVQTSLHVKSKGDDIALSFAGQANLLNGTFTIKQGSLTSRQTKVVLSGDLNRLKTPDPAVDLKIDIPQLNFADISAFVALPRGIKIDKPLKGVLSVKGNQKTMEVQSQLALGSVHVDGRGRVQNVFSNQPSIAFHLETNAFAIAEVLAYEPSMVPPGISLSGNTRLSADLSGTSTAAQFAVKWIGTDLQVKQGDTLAKPGGFPLELSMTGDVPSMTPMKVVIKTMDLRVASNHMTGSGTYEVHGAQSTVNFTAKATRWAIADIAQLSPLLAPYNPTGTLSFEAHATGPVNAPQTTLQTSGDLSMVSIKQDYYEGHNLQMQWALSDVTPDLARVGGTASLKQGPGKILNVQKLAAGSSLGKIVLGPIEVIARLQQIPPFNQVALPNLNAITFESLAGMYQLHSGVLDVKSFDLIGRSLSISDQGTVGLTGDRAMAMKGALKLPPGTIGGTVGALVDKDESGRQLLKFSLTGPMATAKPKPELQDVGKRAIQQAGQEILKNKDVQNAVNDLQNTLKGIFH